MVRYVLSTLILTFSLADVFGQGDPSPAAEGWSASEGSASSGLDLSSAPNPFSSGTNISIQLPRSSRVTLKVYDILGQEIALVASGVMKMGSHRIGYSGSDLPPGRYYLLLYANGTVITRQIMKRE